MIHIKKDKLKQPVNGFFPLFRIFMLNMLAPFRSIIMVVIYPFFTLFCSISVIVLNLIFKQRKLDNFWIKFWTKGTCWMFNVKVKVINAENIPTKSGCLYLFNHTSYFDIWAMSASLPSFRFGAKIELFQIPFFGKAIERVGVLPINRGSKESVFKIYENSKQRMINGERFALSPEGGRQLHPTLAPFKSGPFIFAIQSQAPIIPIVIKNAHRVMSKNSYIPNFFRWSDEITIEVLPPIETKEYSLEDKKKLMDLVFAKMDFALNRSRPGF